jgi:hypothetical protein
LVIVLSLFSLPSFAYAATGTASRSAAFSRSSALAAPLRQLSAIDFDMGSGKISSSPLSAPSTMARATDSGEAFGMSRPRVISVSTGPARTTCTRTPSGAKRARNDCDRLNADAFEIECATMAEVVVKRDAGVIDEDVERLEALNSRPSLHRVGHVQGQGRDAVIRVGRWLARTGIHPLRASPQGLLDQRLSDAAIGPGHQNCSVCDCHIAS